VQQARHGGVVDDLIESDDSEMLVMSMLRGQRPAGRAGRRAPRCPAGPDLLAGPFAHVVVDEAQELTDAEWQMLLLPLPVAQLHHRRRPAQARHGFRGVVAGAARAGRAGPDDLASLSINYRTPARSWRGRAGHPDRAPGRQRSDLHPQPRRVRRVGSTAELRALLDTGLAAHADGIACVISASPSSSRPRRDARVRSLTRSCRRA
jgi:hypothetical protein